MAVATEHSEKDQTEQQTKTAPETTTVPDTGGVEIEEPTSDEQQAAAEALEAADDDNALLEEVAELHQQLAQQKDLVLRAQAEVHNAQRRAQQDVERAHKFALEKLLRDLLPVVDNLERALGTIDSEHEAHKAVVEGVELTHKSFVDTLCKYQIEVVDPAGEPFDPELHQAMTQVPNGDVEPNTVLDVFQKGYRLNGRLIRPAMVVVSKAPQ
ncbi:MAG: nucleotide exchange factor GrpE [Gammaproteobacteria bacterium]|nr:nucleotide exchange factor GrpE [Gammaproteobacteria bacterium]